MPLFSALRTGQPEFSTGGWYAPFGYAWANDSAGTGDGKNFLHLLPFPVGKTASFDRIGTYLSAAQANTNLRLGIYATVNGLPSTLVVDSGSLDSTAGAGDVLSATISVALSPGVYWIGFVWQGAGATAPTVTVMNTASSKPSPFHGPLTTTDLVNASNLDRYYSVTGISGALGNLTAAQMGKGTASSTPTAFLRAA